MEETRKSKNRPFGYIYMLDLYDCDPEAVGSISKCYSFLDKLPEIIGTHKQSPPFIFYTPREYPEKAGLSGWIPVVESGFQIHTIVPKNFVSIDVYSCKGFDREKIKKFAVEVFHPKKIEENFLERGREYY